MLERLTGIFAEQTTKPADSLSLADVIMLDQVLDPGNTDTVSSDDNKASRGMLPHEFGHPLSLGKIGNNEGDTYVVVILLNLFDESFFGREVEHRRGGGQVLGDEIQTKALMVKPERKKTLFSRNLVMEKLHNVLFATVGIVDAIWPEHGTKEDFHLGGFLSKQ
jgi:hypothetical protein